MKKLKYLFTVPENEKVTEKHLMRVLISSVCSILLCMTCLVSTTWAWFTVSISSENNVIGIGQWTEPTAVTEETTQATTENTEVTEATTEATEEVTETTTEAAEETTEVSEETTEATEETTEAAETEA